MTVLQRAAAPTPKFFRILRTIGIFLTTLAAGVIGIETIPDSIAMIASHVATAGAILTAVSQVTVDEKAVAAAARAKKPRSGK
jgi:hypothetical protein